MGSIDWLMKENNWTRRAAGAEHKKRELPNWTAMELIVKLMEWNVKAGEEPPAHNQLKR